MMEATHIRQNQLTSIATEPSNSIGNAGKATRIKSKWREAKRPKRRMFWQHDSARRWSPQKHHAATQLQVQRRSVQRSCHLSNHWPCGNAMMVMRLLRSRMLNLV